MANSPTDSYENPDPSPSCILARSVLLALLASQGSTVATLAGPNGPILPQIKSTFPDAPLIARPGQINAWDNADFVQAIKVIDTIP